MPLPIPKAPQKSPEKPIPKPGPFGGREYLEDWQMREFLSKEAPAKHPKTGQDVLKEQREGYAPLLKKYHIVGKDSYRPGIERMKNDLYNMPEGEAKNKFKKDIEYIEGLEGKK